jgi:AraC-like DNA-binding protein
LSQLLRADYLEVVPLNTKTSLTQAAQTMHVSERTLKRRLQEEGVSFRGLVAEIRARRAQTLMADDSLSLTDIAARMGFSDPSSFSQVFKRWFGHAPWVARRP